MTTATVAARRPLPVQQSRTSSAPPMPKGRVAFDTDPRRVGHRVVIYGAGGIGKTSAACMAPGPVAIFDLDESIPILRSQLPDGVEVNRVVVSSWQQMRDTLHMDGWDEVQTIIIDSATKAEEMAVAWTLANVRHERDGVVIKRIEDYGFGKGYQHVYDTFLTLLGDLDQHVRAGRNVILICHDCTASVPNPNGEDWIRYEPRLQSPSSGKSSIRLRVREWSDHLLFIGYDLTVRDGKGDQKTGSTRTIYPVERPHCMAKSRTLATPEALPKHDASLWTKLLV